MAGPACLTPGPLCPVGLSRGEGVTPPQAGACLAAPRDLALLCPAPGRRSSIGYAVSAYSALPPPGPPVRSAPGCSQSLC